jgi:hypothetical protein
MIVRLNGQFFFEIGSIPQDEIFVIKKGINPKLKKMAATLWTLSGTMFMKSAQASSLWDGMQPLIYLAQDIAMFTGTLAIIAGFIILAFRKRIGVRVIKLAGVIVAGTFLAPAAILLFAIVGIQLNDALTEALNNMREMKNLPVNGGK